MALESRIDDLSASVTVAPVFSISLDDTSLYFGTIKPGETKIIGESRDLHQVRCRVNTGEPWFLKIQLSALRLAERPFFLSGSNLKWRLIESASSSGAMGGREFTEFSDRPALVYAGQADDTKGREVALKFQYSLTVPAEAPAGNYIGLITFTMTQSP